MSSHRVVARLADRIRSLPVARELLQRRYERFFSEAQDKILFRGVYSSFERARAAAPPSRPIGYDNDVSAAMFRDALDRILPADYPPLLWLSLALAEGARTVFDFGGHVGVKYFAFSRYLRYPPDFRWTVCEVPAVARSGVELARARGAESLHFVTEARAADGHHVFYSSGALQFVAPSLPELLEPLTAKPSHVIVNSTSYWDRPTFYTLQNSGTAFCAYKVEHLPSMLEHMARIGYRLVDRWLNPEKSCVVPHHPDYAVRGYTGLYFRRD
jgi:putative methyltransferase (TIGR04325 family)